MKCINTKNHSLLNRSVTFVRSLSLSRSYHRLLLIRRSSTVERHQMFIVITFAFDLQIHKFRDPLKLIVRWNLSTKRLDRHVIDMKN